MKPVTSALVAFLLAAPLFALAGARLGTSEGQGERRLNVFNPSSMSSFADRCWAP